MLCKVYIFELTTESLFLFRHFFIIFNLQSCKHYLALSRIDYMKCCRRDASFPSLTICMRGNLAQFSQKPLNVKMFRITIIRRYFHSFYDEVLEFVQCIKRT